ncbi:MAG: DNA primase [Patescibacteria group bacterium]
MSSPVEEIKQRLTVVDVVGSYIKLQKAGANFKCPCPFHSEKAPSFYVSPAREIWHCFGCNAGGDLFEFVKRIEGVEFAEALRILADRAGVTLTRQTREAVEFRNEKTRLLDLLHTAAYFYQKQLAGNEDVLNYLWSRGLKNETLKDFNVGFSPEEKMGWRNLLNYLKDKGYVAEEIEKAGLVVRKEGSLDFYDRFRGRIMFPLKDTSGRIVGFSGRIFKHSEAKYINTPQTVLYDKSKILYGFDQAKLEIGKEDACILVEGQMDVLMSHQAGVKNAVAVSGTALTVQHLQLIKRLTNNLVMAFDSDEAGLQAAKRSIDLALRDDFEVRAISIPGEKDPADLIKENADIWIKTSRDSVHIIEFYVGVLREKHKGDARKFKLEIEKNVLPYLLFIKSQIDRSHWVKELAKYLEVKEEVVMDELKKIKLSTGSENLRPQKKDMKGRATVLKERLAGISLWKKDKKLIPNAVKELVAEILSNIKKDEKDKLALESELYYSGSEKLEDEIQGLAMELKKESVKNKLEILAEEVRKLEMEGKNEELQKKLVEFQELSKELSKS